jgi:hypothetical protein
LEGSLGVLMGITGVGEGHLSESLIDLLHYLLVIILFGYFLLFEGIEKVLLESLEVFISLLVEVLSLLFFGHSQVLHLQDLVFQDLKSMLILGSFSLHVFLDGMYSFLQNDLLL